MLFFRLRRHFIQNASRRNRLEPLVPAQSHQRSQRLRSDLLTTAFEFDGWQGHIHNLCAVTIMS